MSEHFLRFQVDVEVSSAADLNDVDKLRKKAAERVLNCFAEEWLVDENGEDVDGSDLVPGFQMGDMEGTLPGTGRSWEIADYEPDPDDPDKLIGFTQPDGSVNYVKESEAGYKFTVWYDGCEHGGDFETYEEAIASIRPTEEGD